MPNWCRNRVTVSGTEEDISKLSEIFSDTKSVFNHIIESPDWNRLPNEKGQFPQLERMMIVGIIGTFRTGERSGISPQTP